MADSATNLEPVSVEQDGRILTGVEVTPESLSATMQARVKAETPAPEPTPAPSESAEPEPEPDDDPAPEPAAVDTRARNADGTFAKPTRGQKRFDELTRQREDAKREAQAERSRREALERELASLRAGGGQTEAHARQQDTGGATATTVATAAGTVAYPAHLRAFDAFLAVNPNSQYEDWLEARGEFRLSQRLQALEQTFESRVSARIDAERATRAVQDRVALSQARGRDRYPDFDAVLAAATAVQFSPLHLQAIIDADDSDSLQYHLAKDQALAEQVASEHDPIRLGRLLAQVAARAVAPAASTARTGGSTQAPAPYQPVGSSARTTMPSHQDLAAKHGDDYDASGWRERRRADLREVRRR